MQQEKILCPNCHNEQEKGIVLCADCGMILVANAPRYDKKSLVTGNWIADIVLSFLLCIALMFVGIGVIVAPILYFTLRDTKPFFAKGAGFASLLIILILLGLFLWCMGSLGSFRAD